MESMEVEINLIIIVKRFLYYSLQATAAYENGYSLLSEGREKASRHQR